MKLAEYKKQQNITDEALAALIGDCTVSALRKWLAGDRVPRPDQMKRIVAATGGEVMPNDFYEPLTAENFDAMFPGKVTGDAA